MVTKIATILACAFLCVNEVESQQKTARISTLFFGPVSDIRISKPTLIWKVWSDPGTKITSAIIKVNGKEFNVPYDEKTKTVRFTPEEPLPSGNVEIEASVMVDKWAKFPKKWSLRILPGALNQIPEPSETSKKIVATANDLRHNLGLDPLEIDARLCLSAQLHTDYLVLNEDSGHNQDPAKPGYVGATPEERIRQFGITGGTWEVLASGINNLEEGVTGLFNAPYHRITFMQPGTAGVGGNIRKGIITIDGESPDSNQTVLSPGDGQTNIPLTWNDRESPDPLRIHASAEKTVGYPIVFARFESVTPRISVKKAVLKDSSGKEVLCFLNTPENDRELTQAAFLIPISPLKPKTRYRVEVSATDAGGKDLSKTWTFTTVDSD